MQIPTNACLKSVGPAAVAKRFGCDALLTIFHHFVKFAGHPGTFDGRCLLLLRGGGYLFLRAVVGISSPGLIT
jgi:hypothetical protein